MKVHLCRQGLRLSHAEDTELCRVGLNGVATTHGGAQAEAEVAAGVLWRNDAVVLDS